MQNRPTCILHLACWQSLTLPHKYIISSFKQHSHAECFHYIFLVNASVTYENGYVCYRQCIHASIRTKLSDRCFLALVHTALQRPSFDVNRQRPNSRLSDLLLQPNCERTAKDNAPMSCQLSKEGNIYEVLHTPLMGQSGLVVKEKYR